MRSCKIMNGIKNLQVAGIGLSKTGTMSLNAALKIFGYNSKHYPALILQNNKLQLQDLDKEGYNAAVDLSIAKFYKEIAETSPECKFVLTIREIDAWLNSCGMFFAKIHQDVIVSNTKYLLTEMYGSFIFNRTTWEAAYYTHLNNVINFFSNQPDRLLILDVTKPNSFPALARFLNKPVPDTEFPHLNQSIL